MADGLARTRASEFIFVGVGVAAILLTIVGVLRAVRPGQLIAWLQSIVANARHALLRRNGRSDDEVGRIVNDKMKEMKLVEMRRAFRLLALCMGLLTGLMVMRIRSGTATRDSVPVDIIQLIAHSILAVVTVCPSAVTWNTLDILYFVGILANVIYVSPWFNDPDKLLPKIMMSNLIVLYMTSERRAWRIVVPTNLLYGISSSASILVHWQIAHFRAEQMVAIQLISLAFFPACAHWVEIGIETTLRQSLEADAASELLQAASALLRSCNDVVVELDGAGVIMGQVQDLASFLLRSPHSLLANMRLSDLMAEEDRQPFLRKLEAKRTDGCSLAEAIHVHMRDGNNTQLKVEVLSFGYRRVDGQMRYMTGLRDFSELPSSGRHSPDRVPLPGPPAQQAPEPSFKSEGSQSSSEDESAPTAVRIGNRVSEDVGVGSKAVLIIDSTTEGLRIVGASAGFQLRIGRARPGTCLLDLIHPAEEFANWLEMAAMIGADWPASRVTLRMRQGNFKASCTVLQEDEPDKKHLQLLFDKIKRPKQLSDNSGGRGGPPRPHTNFKGTPAKHGTAANHETPASQETLATDEAPASNHTHSANLKSL